MSSPFNQVGGLRPRRNFFNLSHSWINDIEAGYLYPFLAVDVVSGDKFKVSNNIVIRTQPLFAPLLSEIKVNVEYFYVPNRLVLDNWVDFYTGGADGEYSEPLPVLNGYTPALHSLGDAFGLPVGKQINSDAHVLDVGFRAYNLIWNEYYRDETIDDEIEIATNRDLLRRRRRKDYFTSALPFQQRGVAPVIPVSGSLSGSLSVPDSYLYFDKNVSLSDVTATNQLSQSPYYGSGKYPEAELSRDFLAFSSRGDSDGADPVQSALLNRRFGYSYNNQAAGTNVVYPGIVNGATINDLSGVSVAGLGFSIADLRLQVQLQKFLERNARAGVRYNEFLIAHYGLSPRDSVLQRPQYLGGLRSSLMVSEVQQTSATGASGTTTPQGNLAGRGVGLMSSRVTAYTVSEPGWIIGLISIMPVNLYDSQGLDKKWTRLDRYDYYFPEFAHLSEQPVYTKELYFSADSEKDDVIFGYQGIYDEYRSMRSSVHGSFRVGQALDYWTMARHFANPPALNSAFLAGDFSNEQSRVFTAGSSTPPFYCHVGINLRALRPLPLLAEPGFVDHF